MSFLIFFLFFFLFFFVSRFFQLPTTTPTGQMRFDTQDSAISQHVEKGLSGIVVVQLIVVVHISLAGVFASIDSR